MPIRLSLVFREKIKVGTCSRKLHVPNERGVTQSRHIRVTAMFYMRLFLILQLDDLLTDPSAEDLAKPAGNYSDCGVNGDDRSDESDLFHL